MTKNTLQKFTGFFLVRIIIGAFAIFAMVAFTELIIDSLLRIGRLPSIAILVIVNLFKSVAALLIYILLFRFLEKRRIDELDLSDLPGLASIGFLIGLILQSLFIAVIWAA